LVQDGLTNKTDGEISGAGRRRVWGASELAAGIAGTGTRKGIGTSPSALQDALKGILAGRKEKLEEQKDKSEA
jgi:hypothetical protein